MLGLCQSGSLKGQTSPLRKKKLVTGEVCSIFVMQLAAFQESAGGGLVEESAV